MNSFITSGNSGGFDNGVTSRLSNSPSETQADKTQQVNKEQNLQIQILTAVRI